MKILVTGAAGFIGMHVAESLLDRGNSVLGVDNMRADSEPRLKADRLARLEPRPGFEFLRLDVADRAAMERLFASSGVERVVHLAAQAGVRYSLVNPHAYIESNVLGFMNVLEGCRHHQIAHLVYASSSSVYGGNESVPFNEHQGVDHPVSMYAATKKANELMAHAYSHLYGLPTTGLRFFTVYGPWGRPDMAPFLFTRAILENQPIRIFNEGRMQRDFTYVADIVEGVLRVLDRAPGNDADFDRAKPDPARSWAPYRVFNIGNQEPVELMDFVAAIERAVGRKAIRQLEPIQPGDVVATLADVGELTRWTGFKPKTPIDEGVARFVAWYRGYFGI
jgi:UDP-glucuronate 4-epimerase